MVDVNKNLNDLKNSFIEKVYDTGIPDEAGSASITIEISNRTRLRMDYWRIVRNTSFNVSCFDHKQKYGLPAPIDARVEAEKELLSKEIMSAWMDKETGDLIFEFTDGVKLQALNFTGYEIWQINFPDGTGEYSNHAI